MNLDISMEAGLADFLSQVGGEIERRVTRSAAYAGAEVFYDEARRLVPFKDGVLRDAIYKAWADGLSGNGVQTYRVSWNYRKAPHGHLIEHGHWRVNKVFYKDGRLYFTGERLSTPVWVAPHSFIRAAEDASPRALAAMKTRSVQRLKEVLMDISANGPLLDEE